MQYSTVPLMGISQYVLTFFEKPLKENRALIFFCGTLGEVYGPSFRYIDRTVVYRIGSHIQSHVSASDAAGRTLTPSYQNTGRIAYTWK